jgi:RNA polymerase sigma factor (sigma-70 family)
VRTPFSLQGLMKARQPGQARSGAGGIDLRTDAELVAACLSGEAEAWDALIMRVGPLIYSLAMRMGLSEADAQDVLQEVCLLMLNHLESLRDASRLSGWVASTTRREIWRLHHRSRPTLLSELPEGMPETAYRPLTGDEPADTPEATYIALEDQKLVRDALQHLPDRCRRLLTLLYCEDPPCSYIEVAAQLGMPQGSIGPSRARCLQQLQKILERSGF